METMLRESDLPAGYHRVPLDLIGSPRTLARSTGDCAAPPSAGVNPFGEGCWRRATSAATTRTATGALRELGRVAADRLCAGTSAC
ncbi:hypothetical protein AB0J74_24245 [Asanoa sp. NPDC049573]|uniref:hypothetical protein n=1 Tax=Asanoa sp. NPDC049573 TaxID=3155396 RepID=UPI003416946B